MLPHDDGFACPTDGFRVPMMTSQQVAKRMNVSMSAVKRWVRTGSLRSFKFGASRRFQVRDVQEFIEKRAQKK